MLGEPAPEARQLGQEAGFDLPQRVPDCFWRVVADEVAPAREHVHPDVAVEDHVPPPGRGEDGGRGGARFAEGLEAGLHSLPARFDGEAHAPRRAFLLQERRGRQEDGLFQQRQRRQEAFQWIVVVHGVAPSRKGLKALLYSGQIIEYAISPLA